MLVHGTKNGPQTQNIGEIWLFNAYLVVKKRKTRGQVILIEGGVV